MNGLWIAFAKYYYEYVIGFNPNCKMNNLFIDWYTHPKYSNILCDMYTGF